MYTPPMFRPARAAGWPIVACWWRPMTLTPTYRQTGASRRTMSQIASALAGQHNETAKRIGQQMIVLRRLLDYKSPALAGAPPA